MEDGSAIEKIGYGNFTIVTNDFIYRHGLTGKSKMIFIFIWSKPPTWKFYMKNMMESMTEKKDAIYSGLKELEEHGYIIRKRKYLDGKYDGMKYTMCQDGNLGVSENPIVGTQSENPIGLQSDNPELPQSDNPTHSNTNTSNNTNIPKGKKNASSPTPKKVMIGDVEGSRLATLLLDKMSTISESFKVLTTHKLTLKALSLAIRADGRSEQDIETIIHWLYSGTKQGTFWRGNILSGAKLRKQFDRLMVEKERDKFVWNKSGITKESLHKYLIAEYGNSKPVMKFKRENRTVQVALFGEYNVLADFNTGKYLNEKEADWLWEHMINNQKNLFPNYK